MYTLVSHHLCPYVQRAAIALAEKRIPFTREQIDLAAKPDWFLQLSPTGKVPLLQVGAETLFESAAIVEFLEDRHPESPLHPADPVARARHRAWMEFGSGILADIWTLETTQDPTAFAAKRDVLARKFATLSDALGEGPFFAGAGFSLVDAVFAPIFRYFDVFDRLIDLRLFDAKVSAWRAALAARPSVQQAVGADYADRLHAFLVRHDAWMLRAAA